MLLQPRKNIQVPPILLQRAKLLSSKAKQINKQDIIYPHSRNVPFFQLGHSDTLTMVTTVYKAAASFRSIPTKQPNHGH